MTPPAGSCKLRVMEIGLGGLLTITTIVFVILKLTGVVAWSWWIVFLPLLIGAGLGVVGLILWLILAVFIGNKVRQRI